MWGFEKGYSKFACEREQEIEHNWNILTLKLWPLALCHSRYPWLLNRSLRVHSPGCWLSLLQLVPLRLQLYCLSSTLLASVSTGSLNPTDRNSTVLCSIRRPHITFKLPRGDMDTPPQLLPISSDRDVSLPLSLEWPVWSSSSGNNCHPVPRSLSSGASVYESIMGFFFYLVSFHQPISAHAISSHNCHQNVSLPSGALPWMAFLAVSTGQNITLVFLCSFLCNLRVGRIDV